MGELFFVYPSTLIGLLVALYTPSILLCPLLLGAFNIFYLFLLKKLDMFGGIIHVHNKMKM